MKSFLSHPRFLIWKVALTLFALALPALSQSMWQLTFRYSENGDLALQGADPIRVMKKQARSPNAGGGFQKIPIRLTWLDADGKTLTEARSFLPIGRSVPPLEGAGETSGAAGEQLIVIREPGPRDAASLGVTYVENEPTAPRDPFVPFVSFGLERNFIFTLTSRYDLFFSPPPGPVSSAKIRNTGSDGSRLVFVILGDGYIQADLDSGKYAADVETTLAAFNSASPWDQMIKASNVYRIDVASNQRGADYENAAPNAGGTLKDTYFDTRFHSEFVPGYFVPHLLTPSQAGGLRAQAAADAMVGAGVWDQLIIIVNSPVYGGAGGFLSVNSMHSSGPLISVHEVGHSLAGLADEYGGSDAIFPGSSVSEVNVDVNGTAPKWSAWIDNPKPPLPTPDTTLYSGKVGAFEGARYNNYGIYRPVRSCRMRDLNSDFCPVCKEQHLKSFFADIPFVDSVAPVTSADVNVSSSRNFSVNTVDFDEISYQWFLNGSLLPTATGKSFSLSTANLPAPSQTLSVNATYASPMMRSGAPAQSFSWTVKNTGVTSAGTPHWWLASYGLPTTAGEDTKDHDGDGQTTAAEYIANTLPYDRSSVLEFSTIDFSPSGGSLSFQTKPGRKYRLESCSKLDDWITVTGYDNISGGPMVTYNLPNLSAGKKFYRVVVYLP